MDVAEWLRGLGLEQYAPAFRDNDIDGTVLRRLTAEDLRELGVAAADQIARVARGDEPCPTVGEQGRRAEARELLAPVDRWFIKRFGTAGQKEAATLLAELV